MNRAAHSSKSHGHAVRQLSLGYEIIWYTYVRYAGSRIRYPRRHCRITDKTGAQRFAKKWGVAYE